MGLFKRISDIISANINELTEGLEDPEKMLKQAIREMEESIGEATTQTAKSMANEKRLSRELQRNQEQAQRWQQRASQAVEAGDDDLAKKALTRTNEHQKLTLALEDQIATARESSAMLKHQLEGMKAKLSEAKRSLASLSARQRAANFRKQMASQDIGVCSEVEEDAFAKFDRMKNKVEQAEAEAEAMAELRNSGVAAVAIDDEDDFSSDEDLEVSAELARMKSKLEKE